MPDIPKTYKPEEAEDRIYRAWEKSGLFNPDTCVRKGSASQGAKPYSIVLPPPNVTGTLHMGHAAMLAVEDILVRVARMKGCRTLWVPGTDHAAIATESKVEQLLYKREGKTRHDLGKEEFLKLVEAYAKESHDTIVNQLKKMGASLDWSREAYTLDKERSFAVRTAFSRMYEAGLIYRGDRIVNWDPKMQTTVSDDEIEWKEERAPFYYFRYGPFTIGTARPETKFGDKYVVMHPRDARYKKYKHGEQISVEWITGRVTATIIKDASVDRNFGSGVMTITPWHDKTDFEIAERHELDKEQIIGLNGKLLPVAEDLDGIHIKKARGLVVERLKEKGLLERVDESYTHRIATNSRGGGVIEPQIMRQWFVDVNKEVPFPHKGFRGVRKGEPVSLKRLMMHAVKSGQILILPKRFEKIYYHWIENLHDWCISRQIWFGHQIPVWYKGDLVRAGTSAPRGAGWTQDSDTLDTWFSSGLWTLSALGWPKRTKDLEIYHPTSVLETGYDILFFWVARMILMTVYLEGQVPFRTVYLHGMVRDSQGRKMSKSLGNIMDPLDMIRQYSADATRLSLIAGAAPGSDIKISEDKVRGYRNFANKLWNISRFILLHTEDASPGSRAPLTARDRKILADFRSMQKRADALIADYRLARAAEVLYQYAWHTFADKILESSKGILTGSSKSERASRQKLLLTIFGDLIKLLHPFMPFVTEEIYAHLPAKNKKEFLMVESWPARASL